ncbi:thioredoxin domain-containing protein [Pedobacter sp. SYP-B3415]|uniref:thioredoxin domain-containing protein n=1 Tax=Pedobacter sp. SYP-B3415 TaxID=2496641 RepID=UPI00101D4B86|nr:thioredoxin domain-containing protein [Pedobacter sp. SYP-B3415]
MIIPYIINLESRTDRLTHTLIQFQARPEFAPALPDDLQIRVVFATADHDKDRMAIVTKHFTALNKMADQKKLESALNDWYTRKHGRYEDWAKRYPVTFEPGLKVATQKQKEWCDMANIVATPTILINGRKLPEPYQLEDLRYLLSQSCYIRSI